MHMKKLTAVTLCLVLVATMFAACAGKPKDFRKVNWGADQKAVEKSEETEYIFATDDLIDYYDVMFDINSEILYTFEDSALVGAQAKMQVMEWILKDIIAHYKETAAQLTEQYGAPLDDDFYIWNTEKELYEEHKNDGEHLAMYWKILEFKTEWKTETSYYSLSLNYKDELINYVFYACPLESAPV